MTAAELDEIAKLIEDTYPNTNIFATKNAMDSWNDAIGEYSKTTVLTATRAWIKESSYPPKPADIRRFAIKALSRGKKEEVSPEYIIYWQEKKGRPYEYAALLVKDKDEAIRFKNAGYKDWPMVQIGSSKHKELLEQTERILAEGRNKDNVHGGNIRNFKRDA